MNPDPKAATEESGSKGEAARWRERIRRGEWTRHTSGLAEGHAQANLLVLPVELADDFEEFCRRNPRPCPLLERLPAGDPLTKVVAWHADLRTDLPRYVVFKDGHIVAECEDVAKWWRDDLVSFLLGCSFGFEWALRRAGLPLYHVEQERNVPMYSTNIPLTPAGPFSGTMVVSMRCFPPSLVQRAWEVSARYPRMHGAPIHAGDAAKIGVGDLDRPDFGEAIARPDGCVPVFWPCGVTSQTAALSAHPRLAICHAPGHMLILDRRHDEFEEPPQ